MMDPDSLGAEFNVPPRRRDHHSEIGLSISFKTF